MRHAISNAHPYSWLWFFILLMLPLSYGLYFDKEQQASLNNTQTLPTKMNLSDPLAIRQTRLQEGLVDAEEYTLSEEVKREVVLMGSQFVFIVDAPKTQALNAITQAADAIKKLEKKLSSWVPDSDISRLNERAGLGEVDISDETMALLRLAKDISIETSGAFDVSIGPVWDIWPFRNRSKNIPTQEDIDEAITLVSAKSIELDADSNTAYLPKKGMKVNLGAIGKGYAAGLAIEIMQSLGIERAAVSAGGDIYLLGKKQSGPWVVELEHPRWPGRFLERFVAGNIAIATSGDVKQFIEKGGKRYSHILDPRTGWPVDTSQSVTILTDTPAQADAFATAVYVMGPKEGMLWVESRSNIEALIVDKNGRVHHSSGWEDVTNKNKQLAASELKENSHAK